jgi:hypothetical protein
VVMAVGNFTLMNCLMPVWGILEIVYGACYSSTLITYNDKDGI